MRTLRLETHDLRILIAAITFFALLLILLAPDGYLGSGLWESEGLPLPASK